MDWEHNVSLQPYNSLGLPARARFFHHATKEVELLGDLREVIKDKLELLVIGGGCNLVLARDIDGLALKVDIKGIDIIEENEKSATLKVAAGEPWPELVKHCLKRGFFGLENLSDIPGTAGAAPIQNIGAYGAELSQRLRSVSVMERTTGSRDEIPAADCRFSYRQSRFKGLWRDRYLITAITLKLTKQPQLCLDHAGIQEAMPTHPGPEDVAREVCRLRRLKLPDPKLLGNAGSFFTNPVIEAGQAKDMLAEHADLRMYELGDGRVKLAAGWLVEQCGFKGIRRGPMGVHEKQALVLVHHGGGTGRQLLDLAEEIRATVQARFGVKLEIEPRVVA